MSKISSGVTLTSDFYLNTFYQDNRNAGKASGRKNYSSNELSYEDARALKRSIRKLGSFEFSDEENADNIRSTVTAFVETYNNALSSTGNKSSSDLNKFSKELKSMANKYSDEFKSIGITVEKDGSMTVSDSLLKAADVSDIKKVFSSDNTSVLKTTTRIANRLKNDSYDILYQEMTGNGGRINITL
jgi:ElaB/YqjD/DUF883 family membrane-anchored ribosome-binding protein